MQTLCQLAQKKQISVHSLVLSWMRHKWPHIAHIIGVRTHEHLSDLIGERASGRITGVNAVRFTQKEYDFVCKEVEQQQW